MSLDCFVNNLSELNLSNNVNLEALNCAYNHISDLDLSKQVKLRSSYKFTYVEEKPLSDYLYQEIYVKFPALVESNVHWISDWRTLCEYFPFIPEPAGEFPQYNSIISPYGDIYRIKVTQYAKNPSNIHSASTSQWPALSYFDEPSGILTISVRSEHGLALCYAGYDYDVHFPNRACYMRVCFLDESDREDEEDPEPDEPEPRL